MNKEDIPVEVVTAFEKWLKTNPWTSSLSRAEAGRLGAAKRNLNAALKRHNLSFDEVGKVIV